MYVALCTKLVVHDLSTRGGKRQEKHLELDVNVPVAVDRVDAGLFTLRRRCFRA
jgi:hypothetical protein